MHFNDRILVIDDKVDNVMILDELLGNDYTVRCADSGEEALRIAPLFKPNLILLDVMMPGLNGMETCELLRLNPELRDAKVVMVSALGEIHDRLAAYKFGAVDYITKPFHGEEVLAKVRAWMQMARAKQVEDIWNEIEATRNAMGMALLTMASLRNLEPGERLARIRNYSRALAGRMAVWGPYRREIDERFLDHVYRASPLLDIGKAGIADAIVRNAGALTNAEQESMKRHTTIGAELLGRAAASLPHSGYLKMAADIARFHHERFDGSGYPDGRAGTDIPLSARIVAVADVFDTLTSDRTYAKPMSLAEAQSILDAESGTHFDPAVISALRLQLGDFQLSLTKTAGSVS